MILKNAEQAFVLQKALDAVIQDGDVLEPVEKVILKLMIVIAKRTSQLTMSDDPTARRSFQTANCLDMVSWVQIL